MLYILSHSYNSYVHFRETLKRKITFLDHNPLVSASSLSELLTVPLTHVTSTCSMESGLVLSYDAQCNAASLPNEQWNGRTNVGTTTTTNGCDVLPTSMNGTKKNKNKKKQKIIVAVKSFC